MSSAIFLPICLSHPCTSLDQNLMVFTEPATIFIPTQGRTKNEADLSVRWCFFGLLSSLSPWLCCSLCYLCKDTHLDSRSSAFASFCTPRTIFCSGSSILHRHWTPGVCTFTAKHSGFQGGKHQPKPDSISHWQEGRTWVVRAYSNHPRQSQLG